MNLQIVCLSSATVHMIRTNGTIAQISGLLALSQGTKNQEQHIFEAIRDQNTEVLVARMGHNEILGFLTLHVIHTMRGPYALINDLVIHPSSYGQDVGRRLLQSAHASARIKGCDRVILNCIDWSVEAMVLYRSLGYELQDTGLFAYLG